MLTIEDGYARSEPSILAHICPRGVSRGGCPDPVAGPVPAAVDSPAGSLLSARQHNKCRPPFKDHVVVRLPSAQRI